jgi:transposase
MTCDKVSRTSSFSPTPRLGIPPYSTVQGYFYAWSRDGTFASLNHALVMASREAAGREASPTAGVIDSQSVKTTTRPDTHAQH